MEGRLLLQLAFSFIFSLELQPMIPPTFLVDLPTSIKLI